VSRRINRSSRMLTFAPSAHADGSDCVGLLERFEHTWWHHKMRATSSNLSPAKAGSKSMT
jgi:hypothetical protein